MDNIDQIIILALIQGLTEFLPVSSSAHLILIPTLLQWEDQGIAFDVAIHVGTLVAVLVYFRHDLKLMLRDFVQEIRGKQATRNTRLGLAIVFGTIPVGLAGLLFHNYIATTLRAPIIIAISTLLFGLLLAIAAFVGKQKRNEYSLGWKDVLFIGCAQALSLIPGTSRSGITLTAGLLAGLTRTAAARYSFLLSIPVIILAGLLEAYKVIAANADFDYQGLAVGFSVAALCGYVCIDLFLKLLNRFGVMPFVIYRLALGIILLTVFI